MPTLELFNISSTSSNTIRALNTSDNTLCESLINLLSSSNKTLSDCVSLEVVSGQMMW